MKQTLEAPMISLCPFQIWRGSVHSTPKIRGHDSPPKTDGENWLNHQQLSRELSYFAAKRAIADSDTPRRADVEKTGEWRSTGAAGLDDLSADQRRTAAGPTSTEVSVD